MGDAVAVLRRATACLGVLLAPLLAAAVPSPYPGMGSIIVDGGTSFRVWAPNASSVHLRGTFNGWALTHPMSSDGAAGTWSLYVPGIGAGQPYKYFITNNAPTAPNGTTAWRRDPYSRAVELVFETDFNSVVYDPSAFNWGSGGTFVPPALNELVIYELHIGSFNAPGGTPASFTQAIARLDELQALGVNAVEVMPVNGTAAVNGWGYDPTELLAIRQDYGGPNGFKAFVKGCHERGLAVIVDVVFNHMGSTGNNLYDFDLWHTGTGGGIWLFNDAANRDSPWGPRLDYTRSEVRTAVKDCIRAYLDDFRVDGFRFDATAFMRFGGNGDIPGAKTLLQEITTMVHEEYPGKILIAEDLNADRLATETVAAGGLGFDTEWVDFCNVAADFLSAPEGNRNLGALRTAMQRYLHSDPLKRVVYVESHDTAATADLAYYTLNHRSAYLPRRINTVDPVTNLTTMKLCNIGAVLTFTIPGVPMMFMGEELYATHTFDFPSPPALNWQSLSAAHEGIRTMHRDLISLRRDLKGGTAGLLGSYMEIMVQNEVEDVIAYRRATNSGGEWAMTW